MYIAVICIVAINTMGIWDPFAKLCHCDSLLLLCKQLLVGVIDSSILNNFDYSTPTYVDLLDLSTICEELATVKYKWWDIGLRLHVPYHKLKEFEKEENPLAAVVNYWLKGNVKDVPVTWRSIVAALEAASVDERGLARTIREKYCPSEQTRDKGKY